MALLASLARNEATAASCTTLIKDVAGEAGNQPARSTIRAYLDDLTRLFVLEPLPAWTTHLRSSARLRKSPKRLFIDPSLAVAALAASAGSVAQDKEALGFMFESMAIRDLRVYAQSLGAHLYYYGDSNGLEADVVIDGLDGQWAAVEIKLGGGNAVAGAFESLRAVRSQDRHHPARRTSPPHRAHRIRPRLPDPRRHRRRTFDRPQALIEHRR